MADRRLIDIASRTVYISQVGEYQIGNRVYRFNTENKSVLVQESSFKKIINNVKTFFEKNGMAKIEVRNESTITAIHRLCKSIDGTKVGVLNFASAHNPGGGFLTGAMAQEEALAYCSDLYTKQINGQGAEYYKINKDANSAFYTDTMIMSNVTFFRDANYNFVYPYSSCWVLTAPAVNQRLVTMRGVSEEEGYSVMLERMRKLLYLFVYCGCENIVLGAYGCGVFGNDPEVIAKYWKKLLVEEGLGGYFKSVTFSIYDNPERRVKNIDFFKEEFKNYLK